MGVTEKPEEPKIRDEDRPNPEVAATRRRGHAGPRIFVPDARISLLSAFQMNLTSGQTNTTKESSQLSKNMEVLRITVFVPTFLFFFFFLYFIIAMLNTFFKSPRAQESARYVLFAHMLINDTVYLTLTLLLTVLALYSITFSVPFCYLLVTVSSTSLKVTPYNLAAMSLERYIAICFPLRHGEFCTLRRTYIAIVVIWAIGLIPNFADLIVLGAVDSGIFLLHLKCTRTSLRFTEMQNLIRDFVYISTFSLVGLIIIFTYTRITMVAMKLGSGKASAVKAGKTVLLHAVQLIICMTPFANTLLEMLLKDYSIVLPIINFCFFMCLPRFLSPFIYGIKDEYFQKHMKRYVICKSRKCDPI
ncbi:odorant receptor 131-2-like [Dendropsophus ebraccatus]|uniref:odorant receptor 131-2-like n=1 Tax=Dendropsophus ebraccatus TaxID=150705 RepID=UPI003831953F